MNPAAIGNNLQLASTPSGETIACDGSLVISGESPLREHLVRRCCDYFTVNGYNVVLFCGRGVHSPLRHELERKGAKSLSANPNCCKYNPFTGKDIESFYEYIRETLYEYDISGLDLERSMQVIRSHLEISRFESKGGIPTLRRSVKNASDLFKRLDSLESISNDIHDELMRRISSTASHVIPIDGALHSMSIALRWIINGQGYESSISSGGSYIIECDRNIQHGSFLWHLFRLLKYDLSNTHRVCFVLDGVTSNVAGQIEDGLLCAENRFIIVSKDVFSDFSSNTSMLDSLRASSSIEVFFRHCSAQSRAYIEREFGTRLSLEISYNTNRSSSWNGLPGGIRTSLRESNSSGNSYGGRLIEKPIFNETYVSRLPTNRALVSCHSTGFMGEVTVL